MIMTLGERFRLWRFKTLHQDEYQKMVASIRQVICDNQIMMVDAWYVEKGNRHRKDRTCCKVGKHDS